MGMNFPKNVYGVDKCAVYNFQKLHFGNKLSEMNFPKLLSGFALKQLSVEMNDTRFNYQDWKTKKFSIAIIFKSSMKFNGITIGETKSNVQHTLKVYCHPSISKDLSVFNIFHHGSLYSTNPAS